MNGIRLDSEHKLKTANDFAYMRETGRKKVGRWIVLVSADAVHAKPRFGIVCGRKYHKHAVKRNRARRLIWESLRHLLPEFNRNKEQFLFIPRQSMLNVTQKELEQELRTLLLERGYTKKNGTSGSPPRDG